MPRVAQRSIDALKHQVNLVDVVSPYVQLKRAGRSWKGLSPFTQEKTPSFYVHPDRGFFKCFSTDEGGDLFSFIMKMENLEFIESVEFIARKFNINLEYEAGGPSKSDLSLRKQIFAVNELAANWFHHQFMKSEEAKPVRQYWTEQRGFETAIAEERKIGYAPAALNALALLCQKREITTEAMHQSGLFYAYDNESDHQRFKSRFRGRLMIPIRDVQGRVVAFTARQLPQTPDDDPAREAKYVNSPETPIFNKGRILFGMDHARTHLKEGGSFLLVEGQLDAIRCWSVGLNTAIAPQGTALTEDQLHLLRRYDPKSVECLLDGDRAGRKAALRYVPLALKADLDFRFLLLPEKADPDDLLREHGAEALIPLREQSLNGIELCVRESLPDNRSPNPHEKPAALRQVFELLQHIPSLVAREDYLTQAARLLQVDPATALRDFQQFVPRQDPNPSNTPNPAPSKSTEGLLTQATWELLWLVYHHPEHARAVAEAIDYEWLETTSTAGRILARILAEINEGLLENDASIDSLLETNEDQQILAEISLRELEVESPANQISDCLKTLCRNHLQKLKQDLEQKVANSDLSEKNRLELMREVRTLRDTLSKPINFKIQ
ncbi:MAG: DNA primase [Verrucomicrobia bacterium]|nr:DNA primase [Verrucomicrobiota bacterium]